MKSPIYIDLDNEHSIAFFPDSCRFFQTNQNGKTLIEAIAAGEDYERVFQKLPVTEEQFHSYQKVIESYSIPDCASDCEKHAEEKPSGKHLERLVIQVSNDCNLRCIYCYAAGGAYGGSRKLLEPGTLQLTLDRFYSYYDSISTVQIFGGEPLLNMSAIRSICAYLAEHDEKSGQKTKIGLVTNGILINEEFIELVKKYNILVTVSYDGDTKTNDELRIFADRRGSSERVLENAVRLYEASGEPSTIEVTYTQLHVNNQVGILDIVRNIKAMFPKTGVHLVPVSGGKGSSWALDQYDMFPGSVDEIFASEDPKNAPTYSLVERIFAGMAMHNPNNRYICSAGVGTLSVSVEGEVYPCFMFTNEEALSLGNVRDEGLFESERFRNGLEKLREFSDKTRNPACRDCFIRTLCNGCLGMNASHDGSTFRMNDEVCEMFRQMTTRAIIQYAKHDLLVEKQDETQKA